MNAYEKEKSEREYEDMLTDVYGMVNICGMEYPSGAALKELDPTAFRCGMSDEPVVYVCGECHAEYEDDADAADECCQPEEFEDGSVLLP